MAVSLFILFFNTCIIVSHIYGITKIFNFLLIYWFSLHKILQFKQVKCNIWSKTLLWTIFFSIIYVEIEHLDYSIYKLNCEIKYIHYFQWLFGLKWYYFHNNILFETLKKDSYTCISDTYQVCKMLSIFILNKHGEATALSDI